jgi:hypothetical protein
MFAGIGEDTAIADDDLELSVGKAHLGVDTVFRFEFALQAPGQASLVGSNQASANFDFRVLVHNPYDPARAQSGPASGNAGY